MTESKFLATPLIKIDQETGRIALLLTINSPNLNDQTIDAMSRAGFMLKSEFHVTILDLKPGSIAANTFNNLDEQGQSMVMNEVEKAASNLWEVNPKDELYIVEKQYTDESLPRRSILQLVDCPGLDSFYETLNSISGGKGAFEAPPAHITLATKANPRGIGIRSKQELELLGTPLALQSH